MAKSETKPAAVVVGVGPGLGAALVRRFAREGMGVAIAARRVDKLRDLAAETGGRAYACDATSEISVPSLTAVKMTVLRISNIGRPSPSSAAVENTNRFGRSISTNRPAIGYTVPSGARM